jgi:lactose/L-arabinose transport system permease protein
MKAFRTATKVATYVFLAVASFVCVFPFIWMVFGSTMTSNEVSSGIIKLGSNLSANLTMLIEGEGYFESFLNSAYVAILTTALALIVSSLAAYGFEMYSSKRKEKLFGGLLLTMMIPFAALMIPLYKVVIFLNLNNTFLSLIMPAIATVFLVFFFRQSLKRFPREIIQSARIDGAGELRTFISIVMPSMKPTFAAAAILTFMTSWNNFLWPLITLSSNEMRTLPLKISSLGTSYTPEYGVILLSIVIATIPSVIVFFALQKHFVAGLTGAVK